MKLFRIKFGNHLEVHAEGMGEKTALAMIGATLVLGVLSISVWALVQMLGAG